jgi:uncharacterized OsmC-like protein
VKITLLSDDAVRYEAAPGALTIEAPSAEQQYSPFHMLGSSLASCTFSVLASWAQNAKIPIDDLVIDVRWTFAEKPHRVESIALDFTWPSLPASRLAAAQRAATLCTVHATLSHAPTIAIQGRAADERAA